MRDAAELKEESVQSCIKNASILVAEDEGIIAKDLERRLVRQGYAVSAVVASGEDAIRKAGELRPNLVLMDIVLYGDIDGIDAAGVIRQRFDIPVIYLTAYADDGILERAKLTEPYGYVIKPFEDRDIHSAIEIALYRHALERKVRDSEKWLSTILQSIGDGVIVADAGGGVTFMNPIAEDLTGWSLADAKEKAMGEVFNILSEEDPEFCEDPFGRIIACSSATRFSNDTVLLGRNGSQRMISHSGAPIRDKNDAVLGVVLVFRDVTEQRRLDMALQESEQKLRMHARELEESNTALKVLLKQRENDRRELEENILANVKQLILPHLEKLKRNRALSDELVYVDIVERNLNEIISPFSSRLSSKYFGFTPREIMIADLIRDGKQDKDIMEVLNISYETVKSHRQNIRKKLGIYTTRTNLRTRLMMLGD